MKIFIITMDDPVQTKDFIAKIIDEKQDQIIGLAVPNGDRLTLSKGKSKYEYLVSLMLIMGPYYFIKNSFVTVWHKVKKKLLEDQSEIEAKAAAKEREKFEFERLEMQKKLDDAVKSAEDLKRKAKQGSVQLQGEVQELALEDLLHKLFMSQEIRGT